MDCGSIDIPSSFPCNRDSDGQDRSDTASSTDGADSNRSPTGYPNIR